MFYGTGLGLDEFTGLQGARFGQMTSLGFLGKKKPKPSPTFCKGAKQKKQEKQALNYCASQGYTLQMLGCKPFKFTCAHPPSTVQVPQAPPQPAPVQPATPPLPAPATPPSYYVNSYLPQPFPVYAPPYAVPGGAPPARGYWETLPGDVAAGDEGGIEIAAGGRAGAPGYQPLPAVGPDIESAIYAQHPALPQGFAPIMDASNEISAAEAGACADAAQNAQDEFGPFTIVQVVCPGSQAGGGGGGGLPGVVSSQSLELQEMSMMGRFGGMGQVRRSSGVQAFRRRGRYIG